MREWPLFEGALDAFHDLGSWTWLPCVPSALRRDRWMNRVSTFAEITEAVQRDPGADIVPVGVDIHPDDLTPLSAVARLNVAGGRCFLFESTEDPDGVGRYSFLGVDPSEVLSIRDGVLIRRATGSAEALTSPGENPLIALTGHLGRSRSLARPGLPPFTGGAVGYLGYECVQYLERIRPAAGDPVADDAVVMIFDDVVAFDHARQRVSVVSNIRLQKESLEQGYARAVARLETITTLLRSEGAPGRAYDDPPRPVASRDAPELTAAMGADRYGSGVRAIKKHILRGDILQCVLSDQFSAPVSAPPLSVYRELRRVSPAPYLFFLSMADSGEDDEVLLGASPEMLVKVAGKSIETRPIAGTRPRGATAADDHRLQRNLLASVKERAEHLMLVDLSRNDIGRIASPGSVRVDSFMSVEKFSHVMHIVSSVHGTVKPGVSPLEALLACFPAGTLSGAPKIRAMQIIAEIETMRRGPYGGAVICQDFAGRLNSCIAIRSLHVCDGVARIHVGAGIVADSNPEREYQEIWAKSAAVREAVALAERRALAGTS